MARGLILTSITHSGAVMFISLGLMVGCEAGALCFGMIMGAISPFLDSQKAAAASGILNAGSGIGGAALSPIIQQVSSSAGISTALVMLAAPFVFMIPVVLWMKRKETGSGCDDLSQDSRKSASSLAIFREAIATPDFRRLMAGFGTC